MLSPRFYERYKKFKKGRENFNNNKRIERLYTLTSVEYMSKIKNIILRYYRMITREVAEEVNFPYGSC